MTTLAYYSRPLNYVRTEKTTLSHMNAAAQGALYVWVNDAVVYPRQLAKSIGRGDLIIASPAILTTRLEGVKAIVVDPACELTPQLTEKLAELKAHGINVVIPKPGSDRLSELRRRHMSQVSNMIRMSGLLK